MEPVTVAFAGDMTEVWSLQLERQTNEKGHLRLTCVSPDGRSWSAEATDVFECLMRLRLQMEEVGGRLCCNGARRDAWSSGMQRDMGQGYSCYLLADAPRGLRPPSVRTLDPTDPNKAVTVAEQTAWYQHWAERRR